MNRILFARARPPHGQKNVVYVCADGLAIHYQYEILRIPGEKLADDMRIVDNQRTLFM